MGKKTVEDFDPELLLKVFKGMTPEPPSPPTPPEPFAEEDKTDPIVAAREGEFFHGMTVPEAAEAIYSYSNILEPDEVYYVEGVLSGQETELQRLKNLFEDVVLIGRRVKTVIAPEIEIEREDQTEKDEFEPEEFERPEAPHPTMAIPDVINTGLVKDEWWKK